jgi:hypothetical protein
MRWFAWRGAKSVVVPAATAALTAAVLAGAPALAQSSAHHASPAATAIPVIKSGFKDGPVSINTGVNRVTVASMSLGRGSWAIFAKAYLQGGSAAVLMNCQLIAGGDFDITRPELEAGGTSAFSQSIALSVVHKFTSTGSVRFRCATFGVPVTVNFIKITAIKAGTLTNAQLP